MPDLSPAQLKRLRSEYVQITRLVELQFKSGTLRLNPGIRTITTLDNRQWKPTEGLGSVYGLRQSINGSAPEITIELSGVDGTFLAKANAAQEEYKNRYAFFYWQLFDFDWSPLGSPISITWGRMRSMRFTMTPEESEGFLHKATLSIESPFLGRSRARNGLVTDTDQKRRHPGDWIFSRIAGLESRVITFPDF